MSCICQTECNYDYGGIVALGVPTVRGYVVMKPPKFYIIQFKKKLYDLGYSQSEVEQSVRDFMWIGI